MYGSGQGEELIVDSDNEQAKSEEDKEQKHVQPDHSDFEPTEEIKQSENELIESTIAEEEKKNQITETHSSNKRNLQNEESSVEKEKKEINHERLAFYANSTLETRQNLLGISIKIDSHELRSSTFSQYTVYLIKGKDKNGDFDVYRRFNEFNAVRSCILKRFPGCYVPSIPSKDLMKNNPEVIKLRLRYLNDFVRRMATLPHLYYSTEFQALLRSKEKDVTNTLSGWAPATVTEVITRYKESFAEMLSGREINLDTSARINAFAEMLRRVQGRSEGYRKSFKSLAKEKDKMDAHYINLLGTTVKAYERTNLCGEEFEETEFTKQKGICLNIEFPKMEEHERIVKETLKKNPYWLLFDVMQQEAREAEAFLEAVSALEEYRGQFAAKEVKIMELSKNLLDVNRAGKDGDELRFKIEVQQEKVKKERDECLRLVDIMTASLAYLEIERFQRERIEELRCALHLVASFEINFVQNIGEIWHDWLKAVESIRPS